MKVKNRFVMPPMVRNYATAKGLATERYIAHIERIARGGTGMLILEASFIRPDGKGFTHELGVDTDKTIPGLKKIAKAAQKHGAKIGIQLYHAGRQTSSKTTGMQPVAPSPIPDPLMQEKPKQLSVKEIGELVTAYAEAAERAKKAGMDFVEIHGAHGYLITQFLSPFTNKRKDEYGGSLKNRMRFLEEVYSAVREKVGKKYPIILRLSGEEQVKGGIRLADTQKIAKRMEELGLDALHISVGNYASYSKGHMIPPMAIPDEGLVSLAAGVKKAVKIPVIAVAKIRSPQGAVKILKTKKADFIAIGRTLLADPDYPNKVKDGKLKEMNPCIACNQGCISRLFAQQDVWCTVNPECGREALFAKKTKGKKRILIVGGGPAGLTAAKTAAERGHKVVLYEKTGKLGGQVNLASALPYRKDWDVFLKALIRKVKELGVELKMNAEPESSKLKKGSFDAAIIAVGSSASTPEIPGSGKIRVMNARDVVAGKGKPVGRVVIAGGGCMGAQVAELLAQKKHSVTIVEAGSMIASDAPLDDRALLLERLAKRKVGLLTEHKLVKFGEKSVYVSGSKGKKEIPTDTVVLCFGSISNDGIAKALKPLIKKVVTVGDAKAPRRVTEATVEGSLAVLGL